MTTSTLKRSFFKRQLPTCLVSFTSDRGRELFRHALDEGNAEVYFTLAGCFATQDDPAFCGLSTLSIALNALEVDPLRIWKGAWRWFSDDMLDCCRSLKDVRENGITLSEFACIARCNGLEERTIFADDNASLEQFEQDIQRVCATRNQIIAISYSRAILQQTGTGHFSPIGAYCASQRMVLVLDVARFKYPTYWVPIELLWDSLKPIDPTTGRPRGYTILSRRSSSYGDPYWVQLNLDKYTWANILLTLRDDQREDKEVAAISLHSVLKALISAFPTRVVHRRALPSTNLLDEPILASVSNEMNNPNHTITESLEEISVVDTSNDEGSDIQQQSTIYQAVKAIYTQDIMTTSTSSSNSTSNTEESITLATLIPLAMVQGISGLLSASSQVKLCTLANGCGVDMSTDCCSKSTPIIMEVMAIRDQLVALTTLALDEGSFHQV
ncbi:Phytochelatin synthase-domain-containing protein [Syncephalis plumigaleata]|nr:Phytochelatin synthase-domain-containing protein [Syncephalis plumigaleata]